ncbi:MAG: hypothetical protein JWL97_3712, partial [Gemmatimonadales bacterium]|nr:hypothetical protein [Gemmatimonadales bacterium]
MRNYMAVLLPGALFIARCFRAAVLGEAGFRRCFSVGCVRPRVSLPGGRSTGPSGANEPPRLRVVPIPEDLGRTDKNA